MKKITSISIGFIVAGCFLASSVALAGPPPEPPRAGGIPNCEENLLVCDTDLMQCTIDLAICEATGGQAFPATGQTTCWYFDEGEYVADPQCTNPLTDGQDGDIKAGAELSYTETTYTVIDNNTQLEWMKQDDNGGDCASLPGSLDKDCQFTWDDAFTFVTSLNTAPCFADHCDWRVPNRKELESILNLEKFLPAVSAEFDTGCVATCTVGTCSCTAGAFYWSSTSEARTPGGAWIVTFGNGIVGLRNKIDTEHVRAVRGGL